MIEILNLLRKNNNNMAALPLSKLINEPGRFQAFSRGTEGLLFDYSRVHVDQQAMELLFALAGKCGVSDARTSLFRGDHVNFTERRPAMHMALRNRGLGKRLPEGEFQQMDKAMEQMLRLAESLHLGKLPEDGRTRIRQILHVGIGGSMLGTRLLCEAFEAGRDSPAVHFLGSVDAHVREKLLPGLDPEETVVVLASKSFSTADTLMHGARLQQWLTDSLGHSAASARLIAVTGNQQRAAGMGIPEEQILYLPDWVGGRYSLWSPVSLCAASVGGVTAFRELLHGAADMDRHFLETAFEDNLPVLMGLLGVWHRNICGYSSWGVIPYDQRLRLLPAHLQQLIMESNGKSINEKGQPTGLATAPVIFGECGTDAQHSLFQAMHQGVDKIPLNFVAVIRPAHDDGEAHDELLANMLAQATALATGRTAEETRTQLGATEMQGSAHLVAHRTFDGNRPTELLLLDDLGPRNLGRLLALYEHKVFVESVIWGINAFDQWGVELGKSLAPDIRRSLKDGESRAPGMQELLDYIRKLRKD